MPRLHAPHRTRRTAAALLATLIQLACSAKGVLVVPPAPTAERVHTVRVTPITDPSEKKQLIQDRERIGIITSSWATSAQGWGARSVAPIMPLYSIELLGSDGTLAQYWIGKNSHPPVFPCYVFCSGWWIATATRPDNGLLKKRLPEQVGVPFIGALLDEASSP